PFYYIEYGMAQLGALQLYKNFKNDPNDTLEKYLAALSMGYSRPIPDIYEKAGIHFDFSRDMAGSLMEFVRNEIQTLL
ncbi:M3 family oligoendopeptidase, partial [bacterium]|nr:M3 family oligoendopeptidase [bacterium]